MRNLAFIFLLCVPAFIFSQSFSTVISPISRTLQLGQSVTNVFTVNAIPSGGFMSTVNYQLILPPQLMGAAWITSAVVNSPYPAVYINMDKYLVPHGTHKIVVKSYNGSYEIFDTCALVVPYNPCPDWVRYTTTNSPIPYNYGVCTDVDRSQNFWMGAMFPGSLNCYDKNDKWHTWTNYDHRTYDPLGTLLTADSTQKIYDYGIFDVCTLGDTVYAISSHKVYVVINKNLTMIPGPVTGDEYQTLTLDKNNELWISTQKNVYRLNNGIWYGVNLSAAPFISNLLIRDFEVDTNGHVWFTNGGSGNLYKFDGTFWTTFTGSTFSITAIAMIERAPNGTLWLGSNSAGMVYKFNFNSNSFTPVVYTMQMADVQGITFNSSNQPVIACTSGIYIYNGSSFTFYGTSNSAVVSKGFNAAGRPRMASMDSYGNILGANEAYGFFYHCVFSAIPTGIEQHSKNSQDLKIFPNPTSGSFQITIPGLSASVYLLEIHNLSGAKVHEQKYRAGEEIDLNLANGMYMLRLTDLPSSVNYKGRLVIIH